MRRLSWFLVSLVLLLPLLCIGLLAAAVENQPKVARAMDLNPQSLERADRILRQNDPRRLRPGQVRAIQIAEPDLALALNVLAHRLVRGSARIVLNPGTAELALTLPLPEPLAGRYLNAEATLVPSASGVLRFERLRIGRVRLPAGPANWLAVRCLAALVGADTVELAASTIKQLAIGPGQLAVIYRWDAGLPARLRSAMVPEADRPRFLAYRQRLLTATGAGGPPISLADLLPPVFQLAAQRSAGGDPVAENRVAVVALTFYINHRGLDAIVPGAEPWPRGAIRRVSLAGRDDFPKHFMISAALAMTAGTPLADAIGLYKEYRDSRGGSGFSFNDIAADRAGTRFGESAGNGPDAARRIQQRLGEGVREADFMPSTEGLPEFMAEAEFKQRFGGIGEPAYERMMAEIERRVAALPLYRQNGWTGAAR